MSPKTPNISVKPTKLQMNSSGDKSKYGVVQNEAEDPAKEPLSLPGIGAKVKSNVNLRSLLKPREPELNKDDLKVKRVSSANLSATNRSLKRLRSQSVDDMPLENFTLRQLSKK